MPKVNIERPTQTTFGALRAGAVFETQGHIYIKGYMTGPKDEANLKTATAIHKNGGLMNAGGVEPFEDDKVVHYVTEMTFKVG